MTIDDLFKGVFILDVPSIKEILTLAPPAFYTFFAIAILFFIIRLITRLL